MTREEAIVYFESLLKRFEEMRETETSYWGKVHTETTIEAIRTALAALRPVSREQLSEFKTCDLVDELRKREGVETHIAEPYQDVTVSVNGPAVVLVVID
jgi:hypothetical protein